jgi:hypothetical protein
LYSIRALAIISLSLDKRFLSLTVFKIISSITDLGKILSPKILKISDLNFITSSGSLTGSGGGIGFLTLANGFFSSIFSAFVGFFFFFSTGLIFYNLFVFFSAFFIFLVVVFLAIKSPL